MFKLTYEHLGQTLRSITFENFPSIQEVEQVSGVPLSQNFYNRLRDSTWVVGESGNYSIIEFTIPTVKQLQQIWDDWMKVGVYEDQRFGQYVYNAFNYEVGNSYNIEDAQEVYNLIFNSITKSLDEVLEVD